MSEIGDCYPARARSPLTNPSFYTGAAPGVFCKLLSNVTSSQPRAWLSARIM